MALYRGTVKVSGIGQSFNPENTGTEGQVLTKTNSGYAYCDSQGGDNGPKVDVIVVAGGGGGGCSSYGGGGGGGGVKECIGFLLNSNNISVNIGAGGTSCNNGGDSCFGDIKTYGGGGGGNYAGTGYVKGCDGGNGGGASGSGNCYCVPAIGGYGKGGYNGGTGGYYSGGGGGGAGGPGISGNWGCYNDKNFGGIGGPGYYSEIFCSNCLFGTGGNGGFEGGDIPEAYHGGGQANQNGQFYGGGGGGGYWNGREYYGCCGCQGVVMLRYPTDGSYGITSSTGGDCCFTCDGYCYVEFTSDGTFCITG